MCLMQITKTKDAQIIVYFGLAHVGFNCFVHQQQLCAAGVADWAAATLCTVPGMLRLAGTV